MGTTRDRSGARSRSPRTAPLALASAAAAQEPEVVDPALSVRTVVSGLSQPSTMAFLGADDFLVLEKGTGQVKRVRDGRRVRPRARPAGQLRQSSAGCSASPCTRASARTTASTCSGARAAPAPTARPSTACG